MASTTQLLIKVKPCIHYSVPVCDPAGPIKSRDQKSCELVADLVCNQDGITDAPLLKCLISAK